MDPQNAQDQGNPMAQPPQSVAADALQPAATPVPMVEPPVLAAPVSVASEPPAPSNPNNQEEVSSRPTLGGVPQAAADADVIEAEWVLKAKQIVASTKDNPYEQVRQLNQLKAGYIQKRYNKTVKLPEA